MTFQLSDRAKELIPKARIISFTTWEGKLSPEAIARCQVADDRKRYLTDEDLAALSVEFPQGTAHLETVKFLRDRADEIVSKARAKVLAEFPGITEKGGDLYPPVRAENCWRDFWHFLRSITYGIAGNQPEFTSAEGLQAMELLYQELRVPLEAMIVGLENLKTVSIQEINTSSDPLKISLDPSLDPFDHLINQLKKFKQES